MIKSLIATWVLVLAFASSADAQEPRRSSRYLDVQLRSIPGQVAPGQKLTLIADLSAASGMHVYAPGIEAPYRPIRLRIEPSPLFRILKGPKYPPAKPLELAAIGETVPAYMGQFSIAIDLQLAQRANVDQVEVKGSLDYQTCDDKICYLPVSLPLKWTVNVAKASTRR